MAHRGFHESERENTLSAFLLAEKMGADGIELDVHLTRDNELCVIHDHNTKRTTGIDQKVEDATFEELKAIDKEIPTLKEVFDTIKPTTLIDIELKCETVKQTALSDLVLKLIKEYGREETVMASSFNPMTAQRFKKLSGKAIPVALIYEDDPQVPPPLRRGQGRIFLHADILKPGLIDARRQKFRKIVSVWAVDNKEDAAFFIQKGASILISNRIDLITDTARNTCLNGWRNW